MEDQLTGTIDHVVYSNEETGFTVAHLKNNVSKEKTCIVGALYPIHPGEVISCKGEWKHHPSHGRQFSISYFELTTPQDIKGIEKYLESGMIKGIGPAYAKKIVAKFKEQTLTIIDNEPNRLREIEGIGEKKIQKIIECWSDQQQVRKVMIFLRSHNISASLAQKIYKRFGDESITLLKENPYVIAREIFGIGFKTADKIATSIGIREDAPQRIGCAIEYQLGKLSEDGHTCIPKSILIDQVIEMIGISEEKIKEQIDAIHDEDRIVIASLDTDDTPFIWLKKFYACEMGIGKELKRLIEAPTLIRSVHSTQAIEWIEKKLGIDFAPEQAEAINMCIREKLAIITGGPGTGKSTITKAIVEIFAQLSDKIMLAAPTGKAAKRMSEINHKKAFTIHSLLEFDFTNKGFKKNQYEPLDCDLLIIDEASMIDTFLLYNLLKAIPDHCKVIFIGDIDQLPSVGAGNTLRDMIDSSCIPTMQLKEIFRQAKGSKIITNAHRINQGMFPDLSNGYSSDFIFIHRNEPEEILEQVISLVKFRLPSKRHFDPIKDIQVLSPMKRGIIGIDNLNHELQKQLNPSIQYVEKMGRKFIVGDKVMQIRNNYNKNVFNGDVGIIEEIILDEEILVVNFDHIEVEYEFSELDELVLAYSCSIHKYQGSECPCVILPIHTSHFKLLYKNLLYTGITRGKKLVVVVGSKKALAIAIKNSDVQKRYTGLLTLLQQRLPML